MSEKDFVRTMLKTSPGEFNSAEEQCPGRINWGYSDTEVIEPPVFFLPLQHYLSRWSTR
jgi:hypothetical protein